MPSVTESTGRLCVDATSACDDQLFGPLMLLVPEMAAYSVNDAVCA